MRCATYLIVGGYAVAYHGFPRQTGDIDFFFEVLKRTPPNWAVLLEFGFGGLVVGKSDFLRPNKIIQLGYPPDRIDLLTSISGVNFGVAWEKRVVAELDGLTVNFVRRSELLTKKAAAGRPKDKIDMDFLS